MLGPNLIDIPYLPHGVLQVIYSLESYLHPKFAIGGPQLPITMPASLLDCFETNYLILISF